MFFKSTTIPESDFLRVDPVSGAECIIIVFSHLNYPAGKFAMSRELQDIHASKIFVNCRFNAWYQEGIPDVAPSIDATVILLQKLIDNLGGKKVICVGMSMGGYAALLFGLLLQCSHILAFTAEITLGDLHSRSYYANDLKQYDYRYRSLQPLIIANKKTQIWAIYGTYDQSDLAHLWPLAGMVETNELLNMFLVVGDHRVTYRLKISSILKKLIENSQLNIEDISTRYYVSSDITADEILLYGEVRRAFVGDKKLSLYPLLKYHPKRTERAHLSYWFAIVCFDMKAFDESEASLVRALELDPDSFEIFHLMGMVLASQMRHMDAIKNYTIATQLEPRAHMSFFRAGNSWEKLGRNVDALNCYHQVLNIMPEHVEAMACLRALTATNATH